MRLRRGHGVSVGGLGVKAAHASYLCVMLCAGHIFGFIFLLFSFPPFFSFFPIALLQLFYEYMSKIKNEIFPEN